MAATTPSGVATAQSRPIPTVRDTEIERTLRVYAEPLFRVAALDPQAVRIIVVNDRALNAFVAGGQNLFVNTGLLLRTTHPGQVIGVFAHEIGHIAGGHLARLNDAVGQAALISLLTSVLGIAAIAMAQSSQSREPVPGMRGTPSPGGTRGTGDIGLNQLLSFTRSQESQADQAALSFLDSAGLSSRGLLEFMELLANQEFLSGARQDPYVRTHPLSRERVDSIRAHVQRSRYASMSVPPDWLAAHRRMRAKLQAFLDQPGATLQRFPATDTSQEARYARAIAYHRASDLPNGLAAIDQLLADYPQDPFFHELRGQILFEHGRVLEALPSLRRALQLLPEADLFRIDLAQALLELNDPRLLREAQTLLTEARRTEARTARLWRLSAIAYGRDGQQGLTAQALAEQAILEGRVGEALEHARRAMRLLPNGSPGWLRAQDVETFALSMREQLGR
ncbi:MAG: M48 family peptidase [Alphaproteobacteria bacterium]|nr:MAG: M48 family peptidase [Alphaproteobacteria bacterium]